MFLPTSPKPPRAMMRSAPFIAQSWQQAAAVPREERRLADVAQPERLRHEPLEAEREAAVRRHPPAESVQVAGKRHLVQASCGERRRVVRVPVETLPAGDDLEPAIEQ